MIGNIKKIYQLLNLENLCLFGIFAAIFSAVIPVRGTDVWYVQYLALFSVFVLGIAIYLLDFNKFLAGFLTMAWYSTIFTAGQNPRSIFLLIQLAFGCLAIKLISNFNKKFAKRAFFFIFIAALINGAYVILQYFNLDPVFNSITNPKMDDTVGFLGSHNQLGVFMSTTAPVILSIFPLLAVLNIFSIFCSKTASSWIGLMAGVIFVSYFLNKNTLKLFWPVIAAVLLATAIYFWKVDQFVAKTYGERLNLYNHAITSVLNEKIKLKHDNMTIVKTCNKLFGYGLGSFTVLSPPAQEYFLVISSMRNGDKHGHRYEHVHNDYLETLFEMGIVGFILMIVLVVDIFVKFFRANKSQIIVISFSVILAQMVNSLGVYTVQTAPSGMLLILFLGIFYGEIRRQKMEGVYASKAGTKTCLV